MLLIFTSISDLRQYGTTKAFKKLYQLHSGENFSYRLYITPNISDKSFYEFTLDNKKELKDRICTITDFLTQVNRDTLFENNLDVLISAELEKTDYRSSTTAKVFKVKKIQTVKVTKEDSCIYLGDKDPEQIQKAFSIQSELIPIDNAVSEVKRESTVEECKSGAKFSALSWGM